jgi:NADH-quinone oxidoreductase subunit L
MMALSGVPLFFSSFWSKDEILYGALLWPPSRAPFYLGVFGAFFTAFYMTRQMCYVFFGVNRSGVANHHAPHESPSLMTVPLIILAVGTVLLSIIGTPVWPWFHAYLTGHLGHLEIARSIPSSALLVMLISVCFVTMGIGLAWSLYGRRPVETAEQPDAFEQLQPDVYSMLRRKFYIDEIYETTIVQLNAKCSRAIDWLDRVVLDGLVQLVSYLVVGLSWLNRLFDELIVNLGFDKVCGSLRTSAKILSFLQNGQVQRYLRVIGLALIVFGIVFIWGCR